NGFYNGNFKSGIQMTGFTGAVMLSGVDAAKNVTTGLVVDGAGSVSDTGSSYTSNLNDGMTLQNITGNVTLGNVTATGNGTNAVVVSESAAGSGQVILDNSAGTAVHGDGNILLSAGTGGIVEKGTNVSGTADLATTGPSIS